MNYFDKPENVESYIRMVEGYDGTDLYLLARHFAVTGSDSSRVFVDRYKAAHPDAYSVAR